MVKLACRYNRPTELAIMGCDRLDYACTSERHWTHLSDKVWHFVHMIEDATGVHVGILGTGFRTEDHA